MKRFIVSILCVTVFCVGLGALVEKVGARFKSDEKALAIVKQARLAIGGEQSIADVRSMIIKGNTTHTFKLESGARTEQGELEIAMQLPDKLSKMVRIGRHEGGEGEKIIEQKHDVVVVNGEGPAGGEGVKRFVITKKDGGNEEIEKVVGPGKEGEFRTSDGKKITVRKVDGDEVDRVVLHGDKAGMLAERTAPRQNELLRLSLGLLLTAPQGMDVTYTLAGEGDVDGTACNIINAEFAGASVRLYIAKSSSLPVMVSYLGHAMPNVIRFEKALPHDGQPKDKMLFRHAVDAPLAEVQVRFADYRSVNGVQLPYRWTTSIAGQTTEVLDVTAYELNPANIAEKFQNQKILVRTKKEGI